MDTTNDSMTRRRSDPGTSRTGGVDAAWVAANLAEPQSSPVSRADLVILSRYLIPKSLQRGEVLFDAGQKPTGVWILQAGALELVSGSGPSKVLIRLLKPGEAVGDIQLIRGVASPFKARAAEPSDCLFIPAGDFLGLLLSSRTIARRWASKLALQVSRNHDRIIALLTGSVRERVARCLLAESTNGAFRHSQGMIASMLGLHRSSVNEVLRDLERLGVIEVTYRCIAITDEDRLGEVADGRVG